MSKQVHSRIIVRKEGHADPKPPDRMMRVAEKRNALITLAEQIAQNKVIVYRNYPYPGGDKHFPWQPKMRVVSLYYPHAVGGPLFIDELQFKYEVDSCRVKAIAMKELGLRYCYIAPESSMEDAVAQLEE
jgi:hypothetical protein